MFHLPFNIQPNSDKINISDQLLLLGSCFADSMGDKLHANKFQTLSNPFGTIYNPLSLFKILRGQVDKDQSIENQGVYYHWDAHGKISSLCELGLKSTLEEQQSALQRKLQIADWLIITFGSAYVYRLKSTGTLVAN